MMTLTKSETARPGKSSKYERLCKPRFAEIKRERINGATMIDIAKFIGISEQTLYNWINKHEEFAQVMDEAETQLSANVEYVATYALLDKLRDKMVTTEQILEDGEIVREKRQLVKADTTAIIFALKSRNPQKWDQLATARVKDAEKADDLNQQILDTLSKYDPKNFIETAKEENETMTDEELEELLLGKK